MISKNISHSRGFDDDPRTDDKKLLTNKGVVTLDDQPLEDAVKDCSGNATKSSGSLVVGLILDDPLGASLEPGLAEDLDHQVGRLAGENAQSNPTTLGPVVATPRLELNSAASHNTSR